MAVEGETRRLVRDGERRGYGGGERRSCTPLGLE